MSDENSQKVKFPANIGTTVKRAIRHLGETGGSSFVDIKKYLLSKYQDQSGEMLNSTNIKMFLKDAVDTGALLKLNNGKYKMKETARSRSRSRSKGTGRRRSRSRKRSGGRRRSRSGSRKRRRSSSGRRRKRSTSTKRRRRRRAKVPAEE